jgi:hypothetical protein
VKVAPQRTPPGSKRGANLARPAASVADAGNGAAKNPYSERRGFFSKTRESFPKRRNITKGQTAMGGNLGPIRAASMAETEAEPRVSFQAPCRYSRE